ncbi:hypothetical protein AGMMS50262_24150 [Bacteroidia bacterium]|nr:hypothetical protein AGMMS50262_24150 [Bacteroidia bacterium]
MAIINIPYMNMNIIAGMNIAFQQVAVVELAVVVVVAILIIMMQKLLEKEYAMLITELLRLQL